MKNRKLFSVLFLRSEHGFTLVELLITTVISSLVLGAMVMAYQGQTRSYTAQEQVAEMQQNIRAAMHVISNDLRMAGYDPRSTAGATFTAANATSFTFSQVADTDGTDNDGDGTVDEADELLVLTYRLYDAFGDGGLDLGRQVGAAAIQAVAENIDAVEFFYTLANGTQTTAPATLDDIRSVQISMLARAGVRDPNVNNNAGYSPASGNAAWDINGGAAGTGNPVNDNFRRRLQIETIFCRNMGL